MAEAASKSPLVALLGLFLLLGSCREGDVPGAGPSPKPAPVRCYAQVQRARAGHYLLSRPVDCRKDRHHFQVRGELSRPERIDEWDREGRLLKSTSLRYAPAGYPAEEGVTVHRLRRVRNMPDRNTRAILDEEVRGPMRVVRHLDHGARVLRVDKFRGDELLERVERRYRGARLQEERGLDGQGSLRYTMRMVREGGKRFREVYGPGGGLQSRVEMPAED